jgi:hypothetical protein
MPIPTANRQDRRKSPDRSTAPRNFFSREAANALREFFMLLILRARSIWHRVCTTARQPE